MDDIYQGGHINTAGGDLQGKMGNQGFSVIVTLLLTERRLSEFIGMASGAALRIIGVETWGIEPALRDV